MERHSVSVGAVDIGASSGRVLGVSFDGSSISVEEAYRFPNGAVPGANGTLRWDFNALLENVVAGLRALGTKNSELRSVGVDTWGVDFGLLQTGLLLDQPYCYRDPRTKGMLEKAFQLVPREEIYQATGLQFMELNTLYQLLAMKLAGDPHLQQAEQLLFMPDLLHRGLCGMTTTEYTIASTSQMLDPVLRKWAIDLVKLLGLPPRMLGDISQPGRCLGPLLRSVAGVTGLNGVNVVLPGSHDTASAVVAVPAAATAGKPDWCYISLGTWALMGLEVDCPVVNRAALAMNFTNEGGVSGTIRLLKNITGLWLYQECARNWNAGGGQISFAELDGMAMQSKPFAFFINPDSGEFGQPQDMPAAIARFCEQTGQGVPESKGAISRAILESLCFKFRHVLAMCERLNGGRIETIHIVGGGSKAELICQWAASCCNRRVVAGPVEATAIGNGVVQLISAGFLSSITEARSVISRSFGAKEYLPQNPEQWEAEYQRFLSVTGQEG